jgi:hypothetical protein
MDTHTTPPTDQVTMAARRPSWARRIGWLCLIWLASIAVLGLVSLLLRFCMRLAGLHA